MLISCDTCAMQHTDHCRDCVVTVLADPTPRQGGLIVDADEERAIRELAKAGLIPEIRMTRRLNVSPQPKRHTA